MATTGAPTNAAERKALRQYPEAIDATGFHSPGSVLWP